MKKKRLKHFFIILPFALCFYLGNRVGLLYALTGSIMEALLQLPYLLGQLPLYGFLSVSGLVGGAAALILVQLLRMSSIFYHRKLREGREYGSARWGKAEDIAPYIDPKFENNVILTQTERLTMASRVKPPDLARNKNVLVIGGSGSGKTRFFVKPNLMQMHSSYVVTDPKGTILVECGQMLQRGKYRIKVLNTIDFSRSMHYNPFAYLRSEKDILSLVETLIINTKSKDGKSGDDFWEKAETLLYCALIGYIWYEAPEEEQHFNTLVEMINASEVREEDETYKNAIDLLFEELEDENPEHFAVRQYKKYKLAAGKTAKSILISCGARLAPFDIAEVRELMSYDELELDMLGDRKTALFVIISDTDTTFNFIVSMMYSQLFNLLCTKADSEEYGGRLPIHVRCLLDEFANIGEIPRWKELIATIRSREISACIILQSLSQLKTIYKDSTDTILDNCDTTLFLGGKGKTTLKDLSETMGKETIEQFTNSQNKGNNPTFGVNHQKLGRELMTMDELLQMPGSKCIMQLRGAPPFYSDKYDITRHPRYRYLSDSDKSQALNIQRAIARERRIGQGAPHIEPDQQCTIIYLDELNVNTTSHTQLQQ